MPVLDGCINATFEPGNIGSSSGTPPVIIRSTTFFDPDDYNPDEMTYSFDYSKFYNSGYLYFFGVL